MRRIEEPGKKWLDGKRSRVKRDLNISVLLLLSLSLSLFSTSYILNLIDLLGFYLVE